MRIAYIAAGAGGMYCGSCIHDNALSAALLELGHDVALLPTYTPLRTDERNVSDHRQFFGALNVYLHQKARFFRHLPRLVEGILDHRTVLGWISRLGSSTDPTELGDMSLDVLRGEAGAQRRELDRLVDWLAEQYRPDVVVITNSLLLGLARRIREEVGVPVAVTVQGEDLFVDQLREPFRERVAAELRARAGDADLFIAPSDYYAKHMASRLGVASARMRVVPLGITLDGHDAPLAQRPTGEATVTLGYLARIAPEKGLDLLVDAFLTLASEARHERLRLRVAGYLGPRDRPYWEAQRARVIAAGLGARVDFVGEVDRDGKIAFLRSLDLLAVPTTYHEPKGLFALEAMANGVPVVLPAHGSFPEIVQSTGGGVLHEPDSPEALAAALAGLIAEAGERRALGERGRATVLARRGADDMARATLAVLRELQAGRMEQTA